MCARRDPLVVGLELQAELVVEDAQIAIAAAHHRRGHDCLDFLRHDADIDLVAVIVAEAVEAEAVVEVAKEGDVVLECHVGSPPNNTSDGCDAGSDDAAGPVHALDAIDYSICVRSLESHSRRECGDADSSECKQTHSHLLCLGSKLISSPVNDMRPTSTPCRCFRSQAVLRAVCVHRTFAS